MVWPLSLAPFEAIIITANQKSEAVVEAAEKIYAALTESGMEVLYDDRNDRLGVKFKNAELVGAPFFIVIGDKGLEEGKVELRNRLNDEKVDVSLDDLISGVANSIQGYKEGAYA